MQPGLRAHQSSISRSHIQGRRSSIPGTHAAPVRPALGEHRGPPELFAAFDSNHEVDVEFLSFLDGSTCDGSMDSSSLATSASADSRRLAPKKSIATTSSRRLRRRPMSVVMVVPLSLRHVTNCIYLTYPIAEDAFSPCAVLSQAAPARSLLSEKLLSPPRPRPRWSWPRPSGA
jgi:hypothetical protein